MALEEGAYQNLKQADQEMYLELTLFLHSSSTLSQCELQAPQGRHLSFAYVTLYKVPHILIMVVVMIIIKIKEKTFLRKTITVLNSLLSNFTLKMKQDMTSDFAFQISLFKSDIIWF